MMTSPAAHLLPRPYKAPRERPVRTFLERLLDERALVRPRVRR